MPFTIDDINRIIQSPEKETDLIELKSFSKILNLKQENKKDIACEIIAFANRHGGKIIFGINDDGTPDGFINPDVDRLKANIHDICFNNISPVIEANTQFIESDKGQFFIVHIPKRKGMPHAYIDKRDGPEITRRTYYIRTSHGKKLVSDGQLQWLFQNTGDPKYNYDFRIGFEVDKNMDLIDEVVPSGNYELIDFVSLLKQEERTAIIEQSKFHEFMTGLMPFLLLRSFASFFKDSWHIGIRRGFDRMSSGAIITNENIRSKIYRIHEIPIEGISFSHTLSWDFNKLLDDLIPVGIHVPPETALKIVYVKDTPVSKLVFDNPVFRVEIITGMLSAGAGFHPKGLLHDLLFHRYSLQEQLSAHADYRHYDGACHLIGDFYYPEYDMNEFEKYFGFLNSIKEIIEYEWDFNKKRQEHPPKDIIFLDDKLDKILELIKQQLGK